MELLLHRSRIVERSNRSHHTVFQIHSHDLRSFFPYIQIKMLVCDPFFLKIYGRLTTPHA